VHNNLGNVFVRQGKYQEAVFHLTEALRIKPNLAATHYNLGNVYLIIGNRELALEEYKILKAMNSDLANTLYQKIKQP
jgi:tetratricopeptide (TPR) repeat protein